MSESAAEPSAPSTEPVPGGEPSVDDVMAEGSRVQDRNRDLRVAAEDRDEDAGPDGR